jgi:hypothetical protein
VAQDKPRVEQFVKQRTAADLGEFSRLTMS